MRREGKKSGSREPVLRKAGDLSQVGGGASEGRRAESQGKRERERERKSAPSQVRAMSEGCRCVVPSLKLSAL